MVSTPRVRSPRAESALSPDRADPVLERLRHLHPKIIDLSLGRVNRLLAALGHPERHLPPVVHVAGTNGKGSTIAFLRAFLEQAGYRVHVYTSPHLVRFHERIRLAGALIGDDRLTALLGECEAANGGEAITYFEITTVAALLAFAREAADIVLLETGLGGRLDATNVLDQPAVCAVTRISYDHMAYLGDSLREIAGEKAGILKPGVPAVLAPQPASEAAHSLLRRAREVGAPLVSWGVKRLERGGFRFTGPGRTLELPAPGLPGAHQVINASVALAALTALAERLPVSDQAIRQGLVAVDWPARLQRLRRGPLIEALPAGWELWLDGGHNDSAGEALAAWAATQRDLPLVLIFGMLTTKRATDFLAPLAAHAVSLYAVPIPGEPAALDAEAASAIARAAGISYAQPATSPRAALSALSAVTPAPCRVLICGSLYLAGSVLALNG